jgi:hypothetical protein
MIGRLAKAQNRMAPGGLRWSESPVPRKYSPRLPMVGDDTPITKSWSYVGGGGINAATGQVRWDARAAGDTLYMFTCGLGGLNAPAGWTTLWTGTMPGLAGETYTWRFTQATSAGGPLDTTEGTFTGFTGGIAAGYGFIYRQTGWAVALTGPTVTVTGVTTAQFVPPGTGTMEPIQMMASVCAPGGTYAFGTEVPGTPGHFSVVNNPVTGAKIQVRGTSPTAKGTGSGVFPNNPQYCTFPEPVSAVSLSWGMV